jgi:hypothetical protein
MFDIKITLKKAVRYFVLFLLPVLIDKFIVQYPEIAQLTVGALLVIAYDILKRKVGLRLP